MARPKGRTKTARVTINLDERAYAMLLALAERDDAPVAQIARRAVADFLGRAEPTIDQGTLPLVRPQREEK